MFVTTRKRSLRQGNVFTGVCLSTGEGRQAGGTHPTGVLSCLEEDPKATLLPKEGKKVQSRSHWKFKAGLSVAVYMD